MKKIPLRAAAAALAVILCGCSGGTADAGGTPAETADTSPVQLHIEPEPLKVRVKIDSGSAYDIFDKDSLYSEGVYMVNLDSGTVVLEKDPDKRLIPASLTKIMTALVCLEKISDLSLTVECPQVCFDEFSGDDPNFEGASGAGLEPLQEGLTYRDCLYGLMLPSGCEAANVIAYNVAGSIPSFVAMMNETAGRIGCTNTHFTNAHGLYEEENYSSARDMYLITRYAMDNFPEFTEISCAQEYDMPPNSANPEGYAIRHTNRMSLESSEYYYEGVKGVKTGSINEYFSFNSETGEWDKVETAGARGLVASCSANGYHYLLVTVAAPYYKEDGTVPETQYPFVDHKALFDWALEEFWYRKVISEGDVITSVPVRNGAADSVKAQADGDHFAFLPNSADTADALHFIVPANADPVSAPVKKGDVLGELAIEEGGKTVAVIPLVAASDVAEAAEPAGEAEAADSAA